MWELVVYEIVPWDKLIHVLKIGRFQDLGDCMELYSYAIQRISTADLVGTYIPMCVRVLN